MTKFKCGFKNKILEDANEIRKTYEKYFDDILENGNELIAGDSSIGAETSEKENFELIILENRLYGVMLTFNTFDIGNRLVTWYSMGNSEKMDDFQEVGDSIYFPIGCFIAPEDAKNVINDFLDNPKIMSEHVKWINSDELEWPEDLF